MSSGSATWRASAGVNIAIHTHVNNAESLTPAVAKATRAMLDAGVRDVRNQGVLMRGVNDTTEQLLDLCFALEDEAGITPYYFYMCDMIPFAEHWRLSLGEAQELQHSIMGYLPGFATPRIVCDVPFVGKRWVHQVHTYDTERGISYWTKNYRTSIESADEEALSREYVYYDPIYTLGDSGPVLVARARRRRGHPRRGRGAGPGQPGRRARPVPRPGAEPRGARVGLGSPSRTKSARYGARSARG